MLKSILFTHDDMDGCGCRVVYEIAHLYEEKGKDYDVLNCSNNSLDEDVLKELNSGRISPETTIVFFADLCGRPETLELLKSKSYDVRVFDHHNTNLHALETYPNAVVMERNEAGKKVSGTSLLFQYFNAYALEHPEWEGSKYFNDSTAINMNLFGTFVDTVRSYDTYEWKETGNVRAKELQTLFFMLGIEAFCEQYVKLIQDKDETKLISDHDMIFVRNKINLEQAIIDRFTVNDVIPIQLLGDKDQKMHDGCMVISTKGATMSELGYQFLEKHPEFEFIVGFNLTYPGHEVSFRSRTGLVDTGVEFAARIGGGGHPEASGAPLPKSALNDLINIFMNTLIGYYSL